jgi:hypothetical protein
MILLVQLTKQGDIMKYMKRANIYKASNVTFNAETHEAVSYNWWTFVKRINGALVFNNYGYSNSTRKHQSKVRTLLSELGLTIDIEISAHGGLQRDTWPDQARESIQTKIDAVMSQLNNARRKKALDASRISTLNELHKEKQELEEFISSMN